MLDRKRIEEMLPDEDRTRDIMMMAWEHPGTREILLRRFAGRAKMLPKRRAEKTKPDAVH